MKSDVDFKGMTFKKKVQYIWDYYRYAIMGTLLGIFLIGYFTYEQMTKLQYVFNMTFIVSGLNTETRLELEEDVTDFFVGPDHGRQTVMVDYVPISNSAEGVSKEMLQKFMVKIAAGEIDLIIVDKSDIETMVEQGSISDLNTIEGLDIDNSLIIKSEKDGKPYGISLENSTKLEKYNVNPKNKYVVICRSSSKTESAPKLIEWLMN